MLNACLATVNPRYKCTLFFANSKIYREFREGGEGREFKEVREFREVRDNRDN